MLFDGRRVWIHWQNRQITNNQGEFIGLISVGQDVTERRKAEEVLQRDKETLEALVAEQSEKRVAAEREANRAKRLSDLGRMSASIIHEMRRPLAALSLSLYNIRKKRANPDLDPHLDHFEDKIEETERIIRGVLDFSDLRDPVIQNIDLFGLVTDSIDEFEASYSDGRGEVERELSSFPSTEVRADPRQIKQALLHILRNAADAVEGQLEKITVKGVLSEERVGCEVFDSDEGIPEEDIPQVTDPFYSTKHQGIGLGLSITREIMSMHDGTLEIESTEGVGTKVTVTLPR
jgi:signal transduction histidine kinase